MIRRILTLLILFCFPYYGLWSQNAEARLVFKNGEIKNGYGKVKIKRELDNQIRQTVKFRESKDSDILIYDFSDFKEVIITKNGKAYKYVYLKVLNKGREKVLRVLRESRVTLYSFITPGEYTDFPLGHHLNGYSGKGLNEKDVCVKMERQEMATQLDDNEAFGKNFKKAASYYFRDCEELVKKIEKKEFKKRQLLEIVDFYNSKCE